MHCVYRMTVNLFHLIVSRNIYIKKKKNKNLKKIEKYYRRIIDRRK